MAGTAGDALRQAMAQQNADPRFIALGYEDQLAARQILSEKILSQDPGFQSLAEEDKQAAIRISASQPPALADKNLESLVNAAVARAKQGDPVAMKNVGGLATLNASGRSSVLESLVASGTAASRPAATGPGSILAAGPGLLSKAMTNPTFQRPPPGPPEAVGMPAIQQKSLMVGDDAAKLQVYFGVLGQNDERFSGLPRSQKVGQIVGSLIDSIPFLVIPGGAAEKLAVKGVQAITTSSRMAMNLGKLVLPALSFTAAGAVGQVAQRNALGFVQKAPEMYTDTAAKIASVAGEGAAANFLFSVGIKGVTEFAMPALRALFKNPVLAKDLGTTGKLWWKKAADPVELDKAIAASGGTSAVPQENILSMHPYVRDSAWLRSYTSEAVARDASTLDLRPLDQLALASSDMPDVVFAPKNWAQASAGPYNLWELRTVVKGGNKAEFLLTGEAANLGDLRSKLADMAAMRWSGLEDAAKPSSMQGSQAVIRQGVLQKANAKAYDPFPETVENGFLRPSLRGYLSPTEAQDAMSAAVANGGTALHVKVEITPEMVKRIEANKGFLVDGVPMRVTPVNPDEANALAIITRPADVASIAQAEAFAQRAVKEGAGWTPEEARKFFLVQKGFDGVVDQANGRYEVFFPSRMKWITDQVSKTGALLPKTTAERMAQMGPLGNKIAVQARIEATIGKETLAADSKTLARIATAKFKGTLQTPEVQGFVSQIVNANGIENAGVRVIRAAGTSNRIAEDAITSLQRTADGRLTLTVPEKIVSVEGQRAFIDDVLKKIDDLTPVEGGAAPFRTLRSPQLEELVRSSPSRFSLPFGDEEASRQWLSSIAYSEFGHSMIASVKGGRYALLDASGKLQGTYGSLQEMADSMLLSTLDNRFLRGDLYRQGYTLRGKTGGAYTLSGPGLKTPITSNNLQELLKAADYRPASISNRLAPQDVQINADATTVTFEGKTMFASGKKVRQVMSAFENPDELAAMAKIEHTAVGDAYKIAEGSFRVDVPNLKLTRYFESQKEASAFLASDLKDMRAMKDIANSKGLSFYYDYRSGGFTISDGTTISHAATADEAHALFATYPDMPGAREVLTALDPQADEAVKAAIAQVDPQMMAKWKASAFDRSLVRWDISSLDEEVLPGPQGMVPGVRGAIREFTSTYDRYTEATIVRKLGLKDLGKLMDQNKRSAEAAFTASQEDKRIIAALFTDERGRAMPLERRQAIVAYKEAIGVPEALPRAKETFGDLSMHEQAQLTRLQTYTDNLFRRFGVSPSTYIKGYVSHVRDWALRHWDEASVMSSADELLEKSYGGMSNVPKRLQAFFHNERAQTLLDATMEDDPVKIFSRYVDQGNKEMFMKQPFQDTLDYLKTHWDAMPPDTRTHILTSLKMLGGFHEIQGMVKAENALAAVHEALTKVPLLGKALKPTTAATGKKMFRTIMGATYLGSVGFRPWIALRNTLQNYQMLAPRVGIAPMMEGVERWMKASDAEILKLRDQGILMKGPPVTARLNDEGVFAKITNASMKRVWSTDDFTRGTAAFTAHGLLEDGITQWGRGAFKGDLRKFINFTELRSIQQTSPGVVDQITKLALSGDKTQVEQAKYLFAKTLSDQTMADYSLYSQAPMYTQNLPGYMFGRFGTFSTAYRENIYRGWQNGQGVAGKALFVGRFVGINMAIFGALTALGINGKDFIPGYGGLFGGGPQFQEALQLFQAPNATGPRGAQARQMLEKTFLPVVETSKGLRPNFPSALPGSLQAYYAKQMIGHLQQGDYWKAFLSATTTPTLK